MIRARYVFAATLAGVSFAAVTVLTQQAPPMTSVLAGKKFTPPIKGQAEIDFTQPVTKRVKDMVITMVTVKNTSNAPIPRLTVDETWFDDKSQMVTGGKGFINGLLQPGEVKTIEIQTPFTPKMKANSWQFTHANGPVKPHKVKSLDAPKEPDAKTASDSKKPAAKPAARKKK